MASSLLESLSGLVGPSMVGRVAGQLGESQQSVSTGMQTSFAAILAGLVNQATDSGTMQQVAGLATSQGGAPVDPSVPAATTTPESTSLLSTLFGGNTSGVAGAIAQHAGLKLSSASSILALAGPLVLGALVRSSGGAINASTLSSTLLAQKDSILAALPAGLGSMLGVGKLGDLGSTEYAKLSDTIAAPAMPRVTIPSANTGNRWLMPLLALVVILLLLWAFFGRHRSATSAPAAADTTQSVTAAANTTATAGAAADLGAFVKHKLPDGAELNIPSNGVESHLLAFLDDTNRPVTDTLWFNFDRLNFETGSSRLKPESSEQLSNIAAILKAYPTVNLKIGGYTDNTGNASANMKLSQDRANAVRTDLVGRGAPDSRLAAEGYGDAHPVADNATEAGRAQNRRIAMRVTKK